jgi:hypothetical protein
VSIAVLFQLVPWGELPLEGKHTYGLLNIKLIYFFIIYLTKLSFLRNTQRRIMRLLMNYELQGNIHDLIRVTVPASAWRNWGES